MGILPMVHGLEARATSNITHEEMTAADFSVRQHMEFRSRALEDANFRSCRGQLDRHRNPEVFRKGEGHVYPVHAKRLADDHVIPPRFEILRHHSVAEAVL